MRVIDRLNQYLEIKRISAYAFERACGVANGYLGKQLKGKGSVGSDILEKIGQEYPDLDLTWLITGQGKMLVKPSRRKSLKETEGLEMEDDEKVYAVRNKLIEVLKEQLEVLSASVPAPKKRKRTRK